MWVFHNVSINIVFNYIISTECMNYIVDVEIQSSSVGNTIPIKVCPFSKPILLLTPYDCFLF